MLRTIILIYQMNPLLKYYVKSVHRLDGKVGLPGSGEVSLFGNTTNKTGVSCLSSWGPVNSGSHWEKQLNVTPKGEVVASVKTHTAQKEKRTVDRSITMFGLR